MAGGGLPEALAFAAAFAVTLDVVAPADCLRGRERELVGEVGVDVLGVPGLLPASVRARFASRVAAAELLALFGGAPPADPAFPALPRELPPVEPPLAIFDWTFTFGERFLVDAAFEFPAPPAPARDEFPVPDALAFVI